MNAAERTFGQVAPVFASEGDSEGIHVVNDSARKLAETVDLGFSGAKIPAFQRVGNEAFEAVPVHSPPSSCINPTLGCD